MLGSLFPSVNYGRRVSLGWVVTLPKRADGAVEAAERPAEVVFQFVAIQRELLSDQKDGTVF